MLPCLRNPAVLHHITPVLFLAEMISVFTVGILVVQPYLYEQFPPVILLSQQLFGGFMFVEVLMNLLCIRYVDTRHRGEKAMEIKVCRELSTSETTNADESLRNRKSQHASEDENNIRRKFPYWSWCPCYSCGTVERPPRCHHCPLCKICILKRDHHCYFAGRCIGHRNLRHFAVFLFWAIHAGVYSFIHACVYYVLYVYPDSWVIDILPLVAIMRGFIGYKGCFSTGVLIIMWWGVGFLVTICSQHLLEICYQIPEGRTSFERHMGITLKDTRTFNQHLKAVFGKYPVLNLLFPAHTLFPAIEDPVNWPTIEGTVNSPMMKIGLPLHRHSN